MAPFQYQPFENRFAGSIADIMARRGDIAAAAAQRAGVILSNGTRAIGDIQARGQEQAGQAIAGAVGSAAHTVGQIPAQAAAFTAADQEQKLRQGAIDDRARQASDLQALDKAYAASGGNRQSVIDGLPGHLRGKVAADFATFDKLHLEGKELQAKADAAKIAAFASGGMSIRSHGYDPTAAQLWISDLKQKYADDPSALSQVSQFEQALHNDPSPATVQKIVDPFLQADPKTREDLAKEAADAEIKRYHGVEHDDRAATAAETAKRDEATAANAKTARELEARRVAAEEANARTAAAREKREGAAGSGTLDEAGLDLAATAYRLTRALPSRNAAQNGAILSRAAAQAKQLGDSPAAVMTRQAAFKSDEASLRKIQGMADSAASFENKANGQIGIIRELSPKVSRTDSPLLNGWLLAGKDHVAGDSATHQLFNAVSTFSAEYAKIMEGSTGSAAGSSDAARRAAERLVSAAQGKGSLEDTLKLMQREMDLTIDGYGTTIAHISSRLTGTPGAAPAAAAAPAAVPVVGGGGKGGGPGVVAPGAGPKEGDTMPITDPGYPAGAEKTFRGGHWIRTK